jgi:hypothetical protein
MDPITKIATCCFCGTRALLTMGPGRHELQCRSCGAPISRLRQVPLAAAQPARPAAAAPGKQARPAGPPRPGGRAPAAPPSGRPAVRRHRGWLARAWDEIVDEIEDIFD